MASTTAACRRHTQEPPQPSAVLDAGGASAAGDTMALSSRADAPPPSVPDAAVAAWRVPAWAQPRHASLDQAQPLAQSAGAETTGQDAASAPAGPPPHRADAGRDAATARESGLAMGRHRVGERSLSVALWDGRRFGLRLVPGRIEPGGSGRIPSAWLPQLVAAFNGGFRAVHGRYGLRSEGRTFLPPRPGLATWWRDARGHETLETLDTLAQLEGAEELRQNLSPLLEGGRFNPAGRSNFGALAPGKTDQRTTRSALLRYPDQVWAYAYGIDITAEELAQLGLDTGADYMMALDMNDGQAGFEWLQVGPEAAAEPLRLVPAADTRGNEPRWTGRLAGPVGTRGPRAVAERLQRPMGTPLPRYLPGDTRDFFVLLRR